MDTIIYSELSKSEESEIAKIDQWMIDNDIYVNNNKWSDFTRDSNFKNQFIKKLIRNNGESPYTHLTVESSKFKSLPKFNLGQWHVLNVKVDTPNVEHIDIPGMIVIAMYFIIDARIISLLNEPVSVQSLIKLATKFKPNNICLEQLYGDNDGIYVSEVTSAIQSFLNLSTTGSLEMNYRTNTLGLKVLTGDEHRIEVLWSKVKIPKNHFDNVMDFQEWLFDNGYEEIL